MNELKHGQFYICKRWKLLQWLMDRGFMPNKDMPDPTNFRYRWWEFTNSVELELAIEEYFNQK